MQRRNIEPLLNELLGRWHRWASASVRLDDSLLRDFDALVATLPPRLRAVIVVQARVQAAMADRNEACGAAVWSSPRTDAATASRARARLRDALSRDQARWFGKQRVYLNERGNRVGESNPMAEVSDHEVELALQLREEGFSLADIARKFDVAKSTVQWWVNGGRRGQVPSRVKEVG